MRVAVCIATNGRPKTLSAAVENVLMQTRLPDHLYVCPAASSDVAWSGTEKIPLPCDIVSSGIGLTRQRNAMLKAAGNADIVLFIDDDFLLCPNYIAQMELLFEKEPKCVVATGYVVADGATNKGYSVAVGRGIIASYQVNKQNSVRETYSAYGCNMALNWRILRSTGCSFDERLPLYGWAEDVDFSRQAAQYGSVLMVDAMVGVHLAEKTGRVSGVRLGYSQIANQVYLSRKGTLTRSGSLRKLVQNVAANIAGSITDSEKHIDRRGRLYGNVLGIFDVLTKRSCPSRILDLQ